MCVFSYCIDQCCGSGTAWIRIKLKGWIRIRIKVISWTLIWIRINLQMTSQNVRNMSIYENFFEVFNHSLEARIRSGSASASRIRIRIRVASWIRIRIEVMRIRNIYMGILDAFLR
jgi:hypothetical protein